MSRLLFAAARGARIEPPNAYEYTSVRAVNGKVQSKTYWIARDTESGYIHPEDEHLQYGPISTALRKKAENNTWCSGWEWFLAEAAANEFTEFFDSRIAKPDYPLFYLILAEALADKGL